ncbi:imm11 family protein [Oleiphilus messinensis]
MIYRLSNFGLLRSISFQLLRNIPPRGIGRSRTYSEYEHHFEELIQEPLWPHCRIFKAPILPEWRTKTDLEIKLFSGRMPDIFVLHEAIFVSEVVRLIIEDEDPFDHQFTGVKVVDKKREKVDAREFYTLNMRRYLRIDDLQKPLSTLDYSATPDEKLYLPTIQHDNNLRRLIETLPLWQHFGRHIDKEFLFINETLMNRLKSADVYGIKEYSEYAGKKGETVAHV